MYWLSTKRKFAVLRLECDLTVTRSASEGKRQFPRLRFGLLSNAKVDAKRPIFRLVQLPTAAFFHNLGAKKPTTKERKTRDHYDWEQGSAV